MSLAYSRKHWRQMFRLYLRMIAHWFSHTRLRRRKARPARQSSRPQSPRSDLFTNSRARPPRARVATSRPRRARYRRRTYPPSHRPFHPPRRPSRASRTPRTPLDPPSRARGIASALESLFRVHRRRSIAREDAPSARALAVVGRVRGPNVTVSHDSCGRVAKRRGDRRARASRVSGWSLRIHE